MLHTTLSVSVAASIVVMVVYYSPSASGQAPYERVQETAGNGVSGNRPAKGTTPSGYGGLPIICVRYLPDPAPATTKHSEELDAGKLPALSPENDNGGDRKRRTWIRWGDELGKEQCQLMWSDVPNETLGFARHKYAAPGKYVVQLQSTDRGAAWKDRLVVLVLSLEQDYDLWNFGHIGPPMPPGVECTDVTRFCCPGGYHVETPIRLKNMEGALPGIYEWEITKGIEKVRFVVNEPSDGRKFVGGPTAALPVKPTKCMATGAETLTNDIAITGSPPKSVGGTWSKANGHP
jgi:hypothetical protein